MRNAFAHLISGFLLFAAFGCQAPQHSAELDRSRAALDLRDYATAEAAAQTYIARDPAGPLVAEAYYLKGRALEDRAAANSTEARDNLQSARNAYIAALKAPPNDRTLEGLIRVSLADVAYWQDDFATAAEQGKAAYGLLDDGETKAWALYRTGIAQQRLGRFDEADQTLQLVVEYHPGMEPAQRARSRIGVRAFNVQVATFQNPSLATAAVANLKKMGFNGSTQPAAAGKTVVFAGPYQTYGQAANARLRLTNAYPDALIVP